MEFKILYNLEDNHKHQSTKGRLAVQMFCSFPTVLSTPKQRLRNDRANPPSPLYLSINSFSMDTRFEFHKSNQQKVGPFCFQIFAMLLVPYLLLHPLCRVSMWREDNGIGGWYYHIRHSEKMESSPSRVRLHVVNRGKTQWPHRPFYGFLSPHWARSSISTFLFL